MLNDYNMNYSCRMHRTCDCEIYTSGVISIASQIQLSQRKDRVYFLHKNMKRRQAKLLKRWHRHSYKKQKYLSTRFKVPRQKLPFKGKYPSASFIQHEGQKARVQTLEYFNGKKTEKE